jgi:predicted nucleic acid-binding protein
MIYKKAFVDSDILLDLLLNREPFFIYSSTLFTDEVKTMIELNTSALILANVHYIIAKNINKNAAITSLKYIMKLINVFPFEASHIDSSIATGLADFEDGIQYHIAKGNNCNVIISRNIKHYKTFDIPVLTAGEFLRKIL